MTCFTTFRYGIRWEAEHCSGGRTISSRLMMKIETKHARGQLILQVEGRLAGAFVPELERCWQAARAAQPDRKISLDLKSVTCVDVAGRQLLQSMHDGGVDFRGAKMATQDILDQLTTPCDH